MTKRRFVGIIMMIVSTAIGLYEGIWHLFIQSIMNLIQTYGTWKIVPVILDILKIFIFCPMLMVILFCLWKIGQIFFLDE